MKTEKFPNHSIKLDELAREITENIGNHKALVFSQFLGMLAFIRERLDELGVKYEYFDGSTSAPDREKAIQRFQNDENCKSISDLIKSRWCWFEPNCCRLCIYC